MDNHEVVLYSGVGIVALGVVYYLNRASSDHPTSVATPSATGDSGGTGATSPVPVPPKLPRFVHASAADHWLTPSHKDTTVTPTHHNPPPFVNDVFDISILSGRFDRPDHAVYQDWARERAAGASLLLGTELAGRNSSVIAGNGYGLIHLGPGTKGETALEYKHADWQLESAHAKMVLDGGAPSGRFSNKAYALVTILRNKQNGREFINVQNHDPAHLFKGSRFYNPRNVVLWRKAMAEQAKVIRELERTHPGAAFSVSGDLNSGGPWLKRNMAKLFPGFTGGHGFQYGNIWYKGLESAGPARHFTAHGSDHPVYRLPFRYRKGKAHE